MGKQVFDMSQTWLECIQCGRSNALLIERIFRCSYCGNLFEVSHDFSRLGLNPTEFRQLFEKRAGSFSNASPAWQRSGVWRYKELIMPFLPEEYIVTLGEGNVPIMRAGRHLLEWIGGDIELWIIFEGMTPTGSFKDYGMPVLMSIAKAAGIRIVIGASTGDTSASAAAYATAAGIICIVVLPKGKITSVQLCQPLIHGAKVILLPGNFDDCMKVVQELVKFYGAYPVNSINPSRIEGHQVTVFQIAQFFGWSLPDWIVAPVGNGSNCSSIAKGITTLKKLSIVDSGLFINHAKILGCQSEAANPLSRSWPDYLTSHDTVGEYLYRWKNGYKPIAVGETTATAARIGDPVSWEKVMNGVVLSGGRMVTASEKDLNEAVTICGKDGFFVCPQTGIALAGIRNSVKSGHIKKDSKVVAVSTATGLKFTEAATKQLENEIVEAGDCKTDTVAKIMGL